LSESTGPFCESSRALERRAPHPPIHLVESLLILLGRPVFEGIFGHLDLAELDQDILGILAHVEQLRPAARVAARAFAAKHG
jgi:hypothetical protein